MDAADRRGIVAGRWSNVSLASAPIASAATRCAWARCRARATSPRPSGIADVLAVSYFHAMTLPSADDPEWEGRDRFLLSIGHYAIALYAALIEAGILPDDEIETYGSDDSRLPMSGMAAYTPGMEITGGSLGQGLPIAIGIALGLKRKGSKSFVYNLVLGWRTRRGLDLGGGDVGRQLQARQSHRHRRRQQHAGRRAFDRRAQFRASGPEVRGVRLVRAAGRRQRHRCVVGGLRPRASHAT